VYVESGKKRVFARAVDWPGWCRAGRDEAAALEALANYRDRYAVVTSEAGVARPSDQFDVVERVAGSGGTDFGVPSTVLDRDARPLKAADLERQLKLVGAAWAVFDALVAKAPAELRKGPRGGGRDRDKIVDHVYGAEVAYARQLGVRVQQPALGDAPAVKAFRAELLDALRTPVDGARWPPAYAARRIAWHVLDHAWEMEDRS
jgi:hypothetical protein